MRKYIDTDTRTPQIHRDALSDFLNLLSFEIKSAGSWYSDCDAKANYTADDIELVFYLKGGSLSTIDGTDYSCHVHDLMILPPASLTTSTNCGHSEYEYFYIHFNVKPFHLEERFVNSLLHKGHVLPIETGTPAFMILQAIREEYTRHLPGYRTSIAALLQNLSIVLLRITGVETPARTLTNQREDEFLSCVIKEIHSHPDRPTDIQGLAERMHVSESYLYKCFRNHLRMSPSQYIREKKIEFAIRALSSGNYTVFEVAEMTGFSSVSSFSRFLHTATGKSPRNFLPK